MKKEDYNYFDEFILNDAVPVAGSKSFISSVPFLPFSPSSILSRSTSYSSKRLPSPNSIRTSPCCMTISPSEVN